MKKIKKNNKIGSKTKQKDVKVQETLVANSALEKDIELEPTNKETQKNKLTGIEKINIIFTLCFSFILVIVSIGQYKISNRQTEVAENSNKLTKYEYRFEFYKKLEDLQKEVSIIQKSPQIDMEQFLELNFIILSLYRESALLFDENLSNDINKNLEDHLEFLMEVLNTEMPYDKYKNEMNKLNTRYGEIMNSDNFKQYIDINQIE